MKNMLIGIVIALSASSAAAASLQQSIDDLYGQGQRKMAADWKALGKSADAAVFVHKDIRKTGNGQIAIWIDRELSAPEYFEKEKQYLSIRERALIDCKSARIGTSDTHFYAEHFGAGAIVGVSREANPDLLAIVPDSIEDRLLKIACAPKPHATPARKAKPKK